MRPGELRSRFRGCLLGLAVGDALGAPFEGRTRAPARELAVWAASEQPLRWTDDTAMAIGVARSLVACAGFDGAHMAGVFADAYAMEPWRGYGAGPPQVFAAFRRGAAWHEAAGELFDGQGSHGNGGAMRAAPAGLVGRTRDEVVRLAADQAGITHAHPLGLQGAVMQAVAVAWAAGADAGADPREVVEEVRHAVTAPELRERIERLEDLRAGSSREQVVAALGNGTAAAEAVPTALVAFLRRPRSFPDAVQGAIELGGDTDTIASMTGAVSGALLGEEAIPPAWLHRLEAADQLVALADDLLRLRRR